MKLRAVFLKKRINKPLARFPKEKKKTQVKFRNYRGDVTTDTTEVQRS